MEREWEVDRIKLYQLWRQQPKRTNQQLAEALNRSLSWVKKWIRRFKQTGKPSLAMFKSLSRAPRSRKRQVVAVVRQAILGLRDTLKESYNRVVGPLPILYHLHKDPVLQAQGVYLPRSSRTIWKVLKEGGRIPTRVREHYPLLRPEPLHHWEMDFGQMSDQLEFLDVVDRGTSILVDVQTFVHYNAETALQAVARLLVLNGCPQKLRFDNDPRFVGSWQADGFPSPLMRFLLCLGVQPDVVPPGKPQEKPFAERLVRTLKHECFYVERPDDWLVAMEVAETYRYFYNHDRCAARQDYPRNGLKTSSPGGGGGMLRASEAITRRKRVMETETERVLERIKLYHLMLKYPEWSPRQYAHELGHDPKWVRTWKARFKAATAVTLELFRSHSRAPKTVRRKIGEEAKQLVCQLREQLSEKFHRKAGSRTLQWGLSEYATQHPVAFALPKSRSTIDQILRERGYIQPPRPVIHEPLVLPAPMEEWEIDFGEVWLKDEGVFEFFIAVDRGTSRLVYLEGRLGGYNAESALEAVTRMFIQCGLPRRIRFDRDVRLWGAWTRDSYPSPFVRFLRVLGIRDVICPPRRPDLKPFVERCIATLKYEWFARQFPNSSADALALLEDFPHYYNDERPHQGQACQNRPPSTAFPKLPLLPQLPGEVDPDRWLQSVKGRVYRRRVNSSGTVQVDRQTYAVGTQYAKQGVLVHLDAQARVFRFTIEGRLVKTLPIRGLYGEPLRFWDYFQFIQAEARLVEQHHILLWDLTGDRA